MTAQEMYDYFDQISDVTGNPWFDDSEKDRFLEDIIWDYLNVFLGDRDSPPQMEKNKGATEVIRPLIETVAVTTGSDGILTDALINTQSSIGDIITPLAIRLVTTGVPVKFVRQNDIGAFEDNTYLKGISTIPNYTYDNGGYQLYPKEVYTDLEVICLTKPQAITDLADHIHYQQVARAMAKTGMVVESQALSMMKETTNG